MTTDPKKWHQLLLVTNPPTSDYEGMAMDISRKTFHKDGSVSIRVKPSEAKLVRVASQYTITSGTSASFVGPTSWQITKAGS